MAKIYYRKIVTSDGAYTIDMVPARWKAAVEEMLKTEAEG